MNKNFNGAIKCRDHSITCCVSRRRNTFRSVKNSQTVTTQSSAKLKAPVQPVRWLKQHQRGSERTDEDL